MRHPSPVPEPTQDQHATGALPWALAWQEALYGPHGFYRHQAPSGHFATSAQGLPGAGRLLAEAVLALAHRHGCSRIVDVGAGRGELLGHLRNLAPDLHLTGVDVVERPAGLDVERWLVSPGGTGLPADLVDLQDTLVLAHEWLDVVPCPVVQRAADDDSEGLPRWREVDVTADGSEHPGAPLTGADLEWARAWLGPGVGRAEIGAPRDRALAALLDRVRSGLVVVVDYGHTAADRPRHGTLTGFRSGREVRPVPDGSCDLTAHVAFDALAQVARAQTQLTTQTALLRELLGDPGVPVPHHLATTEPGAYLDAVARRAALTALTAPDGLGDFHWLLAPLTDPPA